jgi:hypothetical protein
LHGFVFVWRILAVLESLLAKQQFFSPFFFHIKNISEQIFLCKRFSRKIFFSKKKKKIFSKKKKYFQKRKNIFKKEKIFSKKKNIFKNKIKNPWATSEIRQNPH